MVGQPSPQVDRPSRDRDRTAPAATNHQGQPHPSAPWSQARSAPDPATPAFPTTPQTWQRSQPHGL